MSEPNRISLLDKLLEFAQFQTAVFFTYGADLAFFEEAILHPLWQRGCRNVLVFMDARRYADTVGDLGGSTTWVGRRYIVIPVDLGAMRAFHPKLALLLGPERGRLLVGSGNLTFTGFGHNHEVYTCLDWTPDHRRFQILISQSWEMIKSVFERWGYAREAGIMLSKGERVSEWLRAPSDPLEELQLLHTLDDRLLDQCGSALENHEVQKITVLSPFLDEAAYALRALYERFQPRAIRLIVQPGRTVGNPEAVQELCRSGLPLSVHLFTENECYQHAKVYVIETGSESFISRAVPTARGQPG